MIVITVLIAVVLFLVFSIRKPSEGRKNEMKKTEFTSIKQQLTLSIKRYEEDIFAISFDSLSAGIQKLYGYYPEELIQKDIWHDQKMIESLKAYRKDPVIQDIYDETMKVFPNLDELTAQLKDALTYYQYYYPKATIPHFYTLVSGIDIYNPTVLLVNDNILIHLDMYLGADCKWYGKIGIPKYISERFDKKYLPIDCFKKALVDRHLPDKRNVTLLDYMIYEGKKLYFTELMFPNSSEQDIIGYSEEKFKWAEKHQYEIWNYIVNKDELFSKSDKTITVYIDESPFTKVFQNNSPGRLGTFIGWKLIKSYMKKNPEISLDELMNNTDSKDILTKSKYKPLKR